jgi:hypothetical protein
MPTSSTPRIRPLRPGLVERPLRSGGYRIAAMKPAMARKMSIDQRKTCGLESLMRVVLRILGQPRPIPREF